MFNKPLFKESFIILIIVGVLHWLATFFYFYWTITEFDSLMHFLGGAWVASIFLWFYFFSGLLTPKNRSKKDFVIITILSIVFIGFAWELFELLFGITSLGSSEYVSDTTLDIILDTIGALCVCFYAFRIEKKQTGVNISDIQNGY